MEKRHHVWMSYPAGTLMDEIDVVVRLNPCYSTRQAAHYYIQRMKKHWADVPDMKDKVLFSKSCLQGCTCRRWE